MHSNFRKEVYLEKLLIFGYIITKNDQVKDTENLE